MRNNTSTGDPVVIVIRDPGLPTEERIELINDLQETIAATLAPADVIDNLVKTFDGAAYATIDADCPVCGAPLALSNLQLNGDNGAKATATCRNCTWSGDATYRLVDLHDPDEDDWQRLTTTSCVNQTAITPTYRSY